MTIDERVEGLRKSATVVVPDYHSRAVLLAEFRRHLTEVEDRARHKEREWAITCIRRYHADMVQKLARGEMES